MRELWEMAGALSQDVFDRLDMGLLYDELDELDDEVQETIRQVEANRNNEFEMLAKGYFVCNENYDSNRNAAATTGKADLSAGELKEAIGRIEKAISVFQKSLTEIHRSVFIKLMEFVQYSGCEFDAESGEYVSTDGAFDDIIDKSNVRKYFCSPMEEYAMPGPTEEPLAWMPFETDEPSNLSDEEPIDLPPPPRITELEHLKSVFRVLRENAEKEQPAQRGYREKRQKTFD